MLRSRPITLLVAAAVGALVIAGLAVHGTGGGVMLAVVVAVLVLLSSATWAHLHPRAQITRGLVIVAVAALAVVKLAGRL